MGKEILKISNLSKSFGKNRVLTKISLTLKEGSVLGLMGENGAGKSTLMKCLFGIYSKDEGNIIYNDKQVEFNGPKQALENGIAMVHQELNQCLDRNVLDNLFLGRYPLTPLKTIDEAKMKRQASDLFNRLGIHADLKNPMRTMSVSARQMVEIAKAVSYNAKIIVLDEPTSSLTEPEVKKLFSIVNSLKKEGVSFIYISHKMDEIFEICDEVSVLRDGHLIFTKATKNTNMAEIVSAMVGRSLDQRFPPVDNKPGEEVLKIDDLSTKFEPKLHEISFSVRKGEIFGLYGLVGAGRTELLETIFGVRTRAKGNVYYKGKIANFRDSKEAMSHNFAFVTEERKLNGLYLKGDLIYNNCIVNLKNYMIGGFILSDTKMKKATEKEISLMHVKCMGPDDMINGLSGGNQQKVIIGKWLERRPHVFLLDEPTRGIDVGAKYEIYQLIIDLAKKGNTIIVVSSEMPEILGITNRIGVMSNGYLSGIVETKKTNQEELLKLSTKYM